MPLRLLRVRHAGISAAGNTGVRATSAPLVHICDHDDLIEPAFLARMAAVLTANATVDVAHSVCGFVDVDGAVLGGQLPYRTPPTGEASRVLASLLHENHIASVAAVENRGRSTIWSHHGIGGR